MTRSAEVSSPILRTSGHGLAGRGDTAHAASRQSPVDLFAIMVADESGLDILATETVEPSGTGRTRTSVGLAKTSEEDTGPRDQTGEPSDEAAAESLALMGLLPSASWHPVRLSDGPELSQTIQGQSGIEAQAKAAPAPAAVEFGRPAPQGQADNAPAFDPLNANDPISTVSVQDGVTQTATASKQAETGNPEEPPLAPPMMAQAPSGPKTDGRTISTDILGGMAPSQQPQAIGKTLQNVSGIGLPIQPTQSGVRLDADLKPAVGISTRPGAGLSKSGRLADALSISLRVEGPRGNGDTTPSRLTADTPTDRIQSGVMTQTSLAPIPSFSVQDGASPRPDAVAGTKAQADLQPVALGPLMTDHPEWEAELIDRIAANFYQDGASIEMELSPETLGALDVKIEVKEGAAEVTFATETREAARLLSQSEAKLTDLMNRAGMNLSGQNASTRDERQPTHRAITETPLTRREAEPSARPESASAPRRGLNILA